MSTPVPGAAAHQAPPPVTQVAPSSANPTTAGAIASQNTEKVNSNTIVKSLNDLRKKAPKVFNAMMQGIAMNICNEMEHHQDRLKTMWREAGRG